MGLLPFLQKRKLRLRTREWRDMSRVGTDVLLSSAQFQFGLLAISFSSAASGWSQERGSLPWAETPVPLQEVAGPERSDPGRMLGWEDHCSCHPKYTKLLGGTCWKEPHFFPWSPTSSTSWAGLQGLLVLNSAPGLWVTVGFFFYVIVFVVQVNECRQLL